MGLFSKGKTGGMMNVIRCDEKEYLVWKWSSVPARERTASDTEAA